MNNIVKVILPTIYGVIVTYRNGITRSFSKRKCPKTVKAFIENAEKVEMDWATVYRLPEMSGDTFTI